MWKAVNYKEEYLDGVLCMTKENYGDIDIANKAYIQHEYFSNPAGVAIIKLAVDAENENKIVGQYVIVPKRIYLNGKLMIVGHPLNILVDKNYRNQGMFYKLGELAHNKEHAESIDLFFATPNPNSSHGYRNKLGFKMVSDMPLMVRPISVLRIVREKLFSNSEPHKEACIYANFADAGCKIVELSKDNLDIADAFWEQIRNKYPIMQCRDSVFMKWRYIDIPIRKYRCFFAIRENRPVAFVATTISIVENMRCGMIVDFLFCDKSESEATQLLKKVLSYFKQSKVALSGCLMNQHATESKILKKVGYFVCPERLQPQPFSLLIKEGNTGIDVSGTKDFANWFFTMGDYDVI